MEKHAQGTRLFTCPTTFWSKPKQAPASASRAFSPIDFKEAALARDQLLNSQAGHYNRDKVNLEQHSPGQPIRIQNENNGLWDLSGEVIDIRPDKLSYLIDIEGRTFVPGRSKIKPVFKAGNFSCRG